jgi:hypothetical protein
VFRAKRVPLELLQNISDYRDFHERDFQAVRDTVKTGMKLKDFGFYFEFVLTLARALSA